MNHRFCHRCQAELAPHEEGTLFFCSHCGAPQVQLSEELKTHLEAQQSAPDAGANVAPTVRGVRSTVWRDALFCVGIAAAIAGVLGLVSLLVAPVILLAWLWAVISPVVVLGVFQARSPLTRVTTGFGARLGLVTGIAIAAVLSIINTAELLIARKMHLMGDFDSRMQDTVDKLRIQMAAQPTEVSTRFVQVLSAPEGRAGMFLGGVAVLVVFLLIVTTAGGAFAGFVRGRRAA